MVDDPVLEVEAVGCQEVVNDCLDGHVEHLGECGTEISSCGVHVEEGLDAECPRENVGNQFPELSETRCRPGCSGKEEADRGDYQEEDEYGFPAGYQCAPGLAEEDAVGHEEEDQQDNVPVVSSLRQAEYGWNDEDDVQGYCHIDHPVGGSTSQDDPPDSMSGEPVWK